MRDLLEALDLWLPAAFPGIHAGPIETWFSAASHAQRGQRLDYIAVPLLWQHFSTTSTTLPDIDTAQANIDHVAIAVQVQGPKPPGRPQKTPGCSQDHKVDWQAVRSCRDHDKWRTIFSSLKQPPWGLDVHAHWQNIYDQLVTLLATAFPRRKSQPRKPYIDDDTWSLRNQRQALRRQMTLRGPLETFRVGSGLFHLAPSDTPARCLISRDSLASTLPCCSAQGQTAVHTASKGTTTCLAVPEDHLLGISCC